jgi:hypothetical protein
LGEHKENIKSSANGSLGLYELKQYIPRFDEECLCFLDQRKQAKLQWLQDPNQNNVHNLNHIRREAIGHCRNKKEGIPES